MDAKDLTHTKISRVHHNRAVAYFDILGFTQVTKSMDDIGNGITSYWGFFNAIHGVLWTAANQHSKFSQDIPIDTEHEGHTSGSWYTHLKPGTVHASVGSDTLVIHSDSLEHVVDATARLMWRFSGWGIPMRVGIALGGVDHIIKSGHYMLANLTVGPGLTNATTIYSLAKGAVQRVFLDKGAFDVLLKSQKYSSLCRTYKPKISIKQRICQRLSFQKGTEQFEFNWWMALFKSNRKDELKEVLDDWEKFQKRWTSDEGPHWLNSAQLNAGIATLAEIRNDLASIL